MPHQQHVVVEFKGQGACRLWDYSTVLQEKKKKVLSLNVFHFSFSYKLNWWVCFVVLRDLDLAKWLRACKVHSSSQFFKHLFPCQCDYVSKYVRVVREALGTLTIH